MINGVVKIYKKKGETPLECIHNYKKDNPDLKYLPITYAGRLDPLAEGVLLLLVGDECQKKDKYLALPKEYEVEVLFGFATDTYDVMGKVSENFGSPESPFGMVWHRLPSPSSEDLSNGLSGEEISLILKNFTGKIRQKYPIYSSRPVQGKPLFQWAREGKLDEIEIPSHDVFVESIDLIGEDFITTEKLLEKIKKDISCVKGDFRQQEIIKLWEETLKPRGPSSGVHKIIKLKIKCGSGVYVRAIANDIGEKLGIPALALNIKRTKVGEYCI